MLLNYEKTKFKKDLTPEDQERIINLYQLISWINKKTQGFVMHEKFLAQKNECTISELNLDLNYLLEHEHIHQNMIYYSGVGYKNQYINVYPPNFKNVKYRNREND